MVRAMVPRKFIEDGKWWAQGRVRGAKIAWLRNLEMQNFALGTRFRAISYIFPALPGDASIDVSLALV